MYLSSGRNCPAALYPAMRVLSIEMVLMITYT
jgi:hypothetical protein